MDIRSVTLFCDPDFPPAKMADFYTAVQAAFPYPLQSTRLALPPFPIWWPTGVHGEAHVQTTAHQLAQQWQAAGASYISLGPVLLDHEAHWIDQIPALLAEADALFATVEIADTRRHLDTFRCQLTAELIKTVSHILPKNFGKGFGNLYFGAIANCPPGSPFFPVAYHQGGPPHFAIAVESADIALQAVQSADSLVEARQHLVEAIETAAFKLTLAARKLANEFHIPFSGIDFSLAPFPTDDKSLGKTLELLGLPHLGSAGSLFAAGFITEAIGRANFPSCGFSGLMLPVLEDSVLAQRAAEGVLTLQDLLTYSAVCGVGLDTIPLAGTVATNEITAVLLDIAMLACRLNKPLTARLMPMPGLALGDLVSFDFPYFADGRVMQIVGTGVEGLLAKNSRLGINTIR